MQSLSKLSIDQLIALRSAIDEEISSKKSQARAEVKVTKVEGKQSTYRLEYKGKMYEAQKGGRYDRYIIYKMEKGLKPGTIKRGAVVQKEFSGDINDLRLAIATGSVK